MGVTKQYLRFIPSGVCNVIASANSSVQYLDNKTCLVGACENVYAWDIKLEEKIGCYSGSKSLVTVIACCPDRTSFSVGYVDGTINVFDVKIQPDEPKLTFSGHRSAVTCLDYSKDGLILASGGKDCVIVVWDIVNEAGRFKLIGHQGPVTQCRFARNDTVLVTSSKDTLIKFWDLSSQHCVYTLADQRSEVWDFVFLRDERQLVTGTAEVELKVYDVSWLENEASGASEQDSTVDDEKLDKKRVKTEQEGSDAYELDEQANNVVRLKRFGTLLRQSKGRVTQLTVSKDERLLLCLGTKFLIDVYQILTQDETQEKIRKKLRKLAKSRKTPGETSTVPDIESEEYNNVSKDTRTRFIRVGEIKMKDRLKHVVFLKTSKSAGYKLLALKDKNAVEELTLTMGTGAGQLLQYASTRRVESVGHRDDVRAAVFSRDCTAFATAAAATLKIWSRASASCVRTLSMDDGAARCTCLAFMLGDRHCVAGDDRGKLHLFDISSSQLIETIDAHDGSISALCFTPDDKGLVTVSADKSVKFWEFELVTDEDRKKLSMTHTRSLQLTEEVLCCKVTHNSKFLAIGLLDNTAKIYFLDTLKFFLSLYGHSLPVLCLDTSTDNTLIVTGSADKNVKIWGMDFGDCHKSLFAHDDSVTCIKFLGKTHHFFSAGKDGKIKQWDADKFERIQVLSGHHSEIWALDVSCNGKFVVSAANDKSIRLWEKSEEILVVQEEEEMEREAEYEKSLEDQEDVVPGEAKSEEFGLASKKTLETIKSAEGIIEALDIARKEALCDKEPNHQQHPLIKAYGSPTISAFVIDVIKRIQSRDLEKGLLIVPYGYIIELLEHLIDCIEKNRHVEMACRCALFLVKVHQGTLLTSDEAVTVVERLKSSCSPKICQIRDLLGFNIAALKFLQLELAEKRQVQLFSEAKQQVAQRKKKRKQLSGAFLLT